MQTYFDELIENGVPETIPSDAFSFEDLYDEHIANNQKSWPQDRRLTVGASECFSCIRKTWFTKMGEKRGVKKDAGFTQSWGAMERGNVIENHYVVPAMVEGLKRRGMELIMAGDGQDTIIDGIHSATLDGLIINATRDLLKNYGIDDMGADCCVLEMKSFDPQVKLQYEKPVHRGQTQMQMGLVRQTTEYKPKYAVLMYINASWLDDIRIFVIPYEEDAYQNGRARNEKVFETKSAGSLQPEGKMDGTCAYCPYTEACAKATVSRVPPKIAALTKKQTAEQDKDFIAELEPLVLARIEAANTETAAEKKKKQLNEEIQQILIRKGTSRAVGGNWKVGYTTQSGKRTLDKGLMIEAGLDPEDFMSEGSGFDVMRVTYSK